MTLRDKIAEIIWAECSINDHKIDIAADAILALPEIAGRPQDIASTPTAELVKRVGELQKKLAEVEAQREHAWNMVAKGDADVIRESLRAEVAEAAITRAYQMGLDAAASECQAIANTINATQDAEYTHMVAISCRNAIRAIQPPEKLAELVKEPNP